MHNIISSCHRFVKSFLIIVLFVFRFLFGYLCSVVSAVQNLISEDSIFSESPAARSFCSSASSLLFVDPDLLTNHPIRQTIIETKNSHFPRPFAISMTIHSASEMNVNALKYLLVEKQLDAFEL